MLPAKVVIHIQLFTLNFFFQLGENSVIGKRYYYSDLTNLEESGLVYTHRSTLSIQSSFLIRWTNYGALCLCIIVNPEMIEELKQKVFPESLKISEHCRTQLKQIWEHDLLDVLHLTEDERDYLIHSFLCRLFKVC